LLETIRTKAHYTTTYITTRVIQSEQHAMLSLFNQSSAITRFLCNDFDAVTNVAGIKIRFHELIRMI